MPLDPRHIERLTAKFPADDHEFNRGYTYIKEFAITTRLDEIDPSWQLKPVASYSRDNQAIVIVEMIVHDVSRVGTGMAAILSNDKGEVNEAEKAAATDAMKRAARLFGIGRYLLNFPKGLNEQTLLRWLDHPNAPTSHATVPNKGAPSPAQENPHNAANQAANSDKPATPKSSIKRDWTLIYSITKDLTHFGGQTKHVKNAIDKLIADGELDPLADDMVWIKTVVNHYATADEVEALIAKLS